MRGIYGIYRIVDYSSNGYYKILQSGLKEKHLFNIEYGASRPKKNFLDRD